MHTRRWTYRLTLIGLLCSILSQACLTFCLRHENTLVYGRNFDWPVGIGAVFINLPGIHKTSFVDSPTVTPLSWTSDYGSVTFNQFSKDVPVGGMNEKGLVIESLVSTAEHIPVKDREATNELQWMQYHLDTCETVDEVIASARKIRITRYAVDLHYFISDRLGQSAVIEFLNNRLTYKYSRTLPIKVLANKPYDLAMKKDRENSRFGNANNMLRNYPVEDDPVDYAYRILNKVAQGSLTKWQIVYDIKALSIYIRTSEAPDTKTIDLNAIKFQDLTATSYANINEAVKGDLLPHFKPYTVTFNNNLMGISLKQLQAYGMLTDLTPTQLAYIASTITNK